MAASHRGEESANTIRTEQVAHSHNHQTNTKRVALFLPYVITWLFRVIQQAWKDHQNGRNLRKRITQEQGSETGDDRPGEAKNETEKPRDDREAQEQTPGTRDNRLKEPKDESKKPRDRRDIPVVATEGSPPSEYYREGRRAKSARHRPVMEFWVHQGGEWPWRIEQIVHRDPSGNARGIWVLEVKDLSAMYWERKDRPGRRIPATVPQAQWPFPRQGKKEDDGDGSSVEERDELMEWLWRR
ncbi:hypothetical protein EKO27_g3352 [Xylaria grammica]|uniref:Uncharacterized protein n=1 Tax=Xylaria grammica TaxID=363999 RepID=A0A439DBG7_9PEZI|nr:hypothetical protein EKO27_g3352 [Xylaria grammica]